MFFAKNEGATVNKLTPNFKKIPFLALLITISALTVLYFTNTLYGFIDLFAFDVAQEDALNALANSIASAVTALVILPLCVCAAISTYSGWKLFILPHASAANVAKLGIVAKAIKIYEKYVYVIQAVAFGIVALVFSLYAFVLTGAENVIEDLAKTAQSLGWSPEDADALVKSFENDAPVLAITYIITFIAIIVFCVFITRAFTAVTNHFVALSEVAEGKKETLPKAPIVTIITGIVFLALSAASQFYTASGFAGATDILLIVFLVVALVFFKTIKFNAVAESTEDAKEEADDASEDVAVEEEVAEVEETPVVAQEAQEEVAAETAEEAEPEVAVAESEAEQVAEAAPETVEETAEEPVAEAAEEATVEVAEETAEEIVEEQSEAEVSEEKTEEAPAAEEAESVNA